jgi:AcrR family transcriptional regulator
VKAIRLAEREGGDVRKRVVDGARRSFLAQGFRNVTMDDLAAGLGVSKKTIYQHFDSKRALLAAVLDDKLAEVQRELEQILADNLPVQQCLAQLVACVQRHTQELQPAFVRDMHREAPDVFEQVSLRRSELIGSAFTRVLTDGQREGVIRRDVPIRLLMDMLLAAVATVINPARLAEIDMTPRQAFSAVMDVFLDGARSTPRGRRR